MSYPELSISRRTNSTKPPSTRRRVHVCVETNLQHSSQKEYFLVVSCHHNALWPSSQFTRGRLVTLVHFGCPTRSGRRCLVPRDRRAALMPSSVPTTTP